MAIRIQFDPSGNPEFPTLILATRSGKQLGLLHAYSPEISESLREESELSFRINKYIDGKKQPLWDEVKSFRLVRYLECDEWYTMKVDINESDETVKNITCVKTAKMELSQINLYGVEINTEDDIDRDDYIDPTIFYNADKPECSLLHRIMKKAPHYKIAHVDASLANIQRTFSFDGQSIADVFHTIEEEIGCLFVANIRTGNDSKLIREISVYDLKTVCNSCGHRGEFSDVCPECESTDLNYGYGEDTTIFVSSGELADQLTLSDDIDSVKNCFRLEAGDDDMTAAVRNYNPNGSGYIWRITSDMKEDMSEELLAKLEQYDKDYEYYQKDYEAAIPTAYLENYNALIKKYKPYKDELEEIEVPIRGYSALLSTLYDVIDMSGYLESSLMPTVDISMSNTNAEEQAKLLTSDNIGVVAVKNLSIASISTINNAVQAAAKIIVSSRYQVKVNTSSYVNQIWNGTLTLTNYSDSEDTATTEIITLTFSDDYEQYLKQQIDKVLAKSETEEFDNTTISGIFKLNLDAFKEEIKKYSLHGLTSFSDACESVISILQEQGVADGNTWSSATTSGEKNLYADLYEPYLNKKELLEAEIAVRDSEIALIDGVFDENDAVAEKGMSQYIGDIIDNIRKYLNLENYLGEELYCELLTYKRDDTYSNSNFVSDGLNNAELIANAQEFLQLANDEISKASEIQHSISSTLNNLLHNEKFKPLLKYFEVGNWIRVEIDDVVYRLRLIQYSISFDDLTTISIEFSDVTKSDSGLSDLQSVVNNFNSIATSYTYTQRQANKSETATKAVKNWFDEGLDVTNTKIGTANNQTQTWDKHGMLFREYDDVTKAYEDTQLKIINSTIAVTDDNWKHTKTAIGKFYYKDPVTGEIKEVYGVNGELLVGKTLVGENLQIYSGDNSFIIDEDGVHITADKIVWESKIPTANVDGLQDSMQKVDDLDKDTQSMITSYVTQYYQSSSQTKVVDGEWTNDMPEREYGKYIWQKTVTTYRNGSTEESTPICISNEDGESALTVQIESSNGNIFMRSNIKTTLTCRVFYGTQEVTNKVKKFTWKKIDQDGNIDESWNRTMSGNVIELTNADVLNKASFTCSIDIDL